MGALPQRTIEYNGFITQAHRWAGFRHRPDDIFICTPSKSGTTWTQAICAMLVFGRADIAVQPGNISPWLDASFRPVEAVHGMLAAQDHRRFIKTHTPFDGIEFYPECTYLACYRDPRDVFFSMSNHLDNINRGITQNVAPEDPVEGFYNWCRFPFEPGKAEHFALVYTLHHLRALWPWRHLPNVHVFHYADFKRDLCAGVRAIARAIDIRLDDRTLDAIAEAASFGRMREHAGQFAPDAGTGVWKNEVEFFSKGRQGQWRGILGPRELAAYRETLANTLTPEAAAWIETGGPLPA